MSFIAEYTTDIQHICGVDNVVADALSRAVSEVKQTLDTRPSPVLEVKTTQNTANNGPVASAALALPAIDHRQLAANNGPVVTAAIALPTIDYRQLAADQRSSQEIANYRTAITALKFKDVPFNDGAFTVLCDISTGKARPVVPTEWTRRVFDAVHGLSHAGARPCQRAIAKRFVWHSMKKNVRQWCKECHPCQASKIHRHIRAPLETRPPPDRRFGSIHVDLVGPLPVSEGCDYLFTIVDRFTRWPEAIPITGALASTCAKALIRHWISRHGIPDDITSDRGPQFTSHLWSELNSILGISASTTTAYHPQANGMVERMHRQLKAALEARLTGANWMDELPIVLLGLRSTWREGADCAPAELVYGSSLRIPGEFLHDSSREATASTEFLRQLQSSMREAIPPPATFHSLPRSQVPNGLAQATHVYVRHDAVRRPLQRPYDGPYRVLRKGDKAFIIDKEGEEYTVSVDRLKIAHGVPGPSTEAVTAQRVPAPPPPTARAQTPARTETTSTPTPTVTTRTGRRVNLPSRFRP